MNEQKLVVILDSVNRTIVGIERKSQSSNKLVLENPAILFVSQKPSGQMSAQIIPVFFRELIKDKNQRCTLEYSLNSIVVTNVILDDQITAQYFAIFRDLEIPVSASNIPVTPEELFGEKKNG